MFASHDSDSRSGIDSLLPHPDIEAGEKPYINHAERRPSTPTFKNLKFSSKVIDGDTALALFSNPDELQEAISSAEEKKLHHKIDFMILLYLSVCYAFFYIDKTTLSYAAIYGIKDELHLEGTQYNWLSSIFYFGFLAWACEPLNLSQRLHDC